MENINEYGQFTVDLWFSGDRPEFESLAIMGLGLAGESGETLEKVKKYIRDGTLDIENIKKELGDVAYYWARLCRFFDLQPSEVLQANVDKLLSRKARGVMRGSGDNR